MDPAIGAGCFIFLKWAVRKAPLGVIQKLLALMAEYGSRFMAITAIDAYHGRNGMLLPCHSGVFSTHTKCLLSAFLQISEAMRRIGKTE